MTSSIRTEPHPCPECGNEDMDRKGPVEPSDSEGRGGTYLFQCPKCKNVEIR